MIVFTLIFSYLFSYLDLFSLAPPSHLFSPSQLIESVDQKESLAVDFSNEDSLILGSFQKKKTVFFKKNPINLESEDEVSLDLESQDETRDFSLPFHSVDVFQLKIQRVFVFLLLSFITFIFFCHFIFTTLFICQPQEPFFIVFRMVSSCLLIPEFFISLSTLFLIYRFCHFKEKLLGRFDLKKSIYFFVMIVFLLLFLNLNVATFSSWRALSLFAKIIEFTFIVYLFFVLGGGIVWSLRKFFQKMYRKISFRNLFSFKRRQFSSFQLLSLKREREEVNTVKKHSQNLRWELFTLRMKSLKCFIYRTFRPFFFLFLPFLMLLLSNYSSAFSFIVYSCMQMFFLWGVLIFFLYFSFKYLHKYRIRSFLFSCVFLIVILSCYFLFQLQSFFISPLPSLSFPIPDYSVMPDIPDKPASILPLKRIFFSSSPFSQVRHHFHHFKDLTEVDIFYLAFILSSFIWLPFLIFSMIILFIYALVLSCKRSVYLDRFHVDDAMVSKHDSSLIPLEFPRIGFLSGQFIGLIIMFLLVLCLNICFAVYLDLHQLYIISLIAVGMGILYLILGGSSFRISIFKFNLRRYYEVRRSLIVGIFFGVISFLMAFLVRDWGTMGSGMFVLFLFFGIFISFLYFCALILICLFIYFCLEGVQAKKSSSLKNDEGDSNKQEEGVNVESESFKKEYEIFDSPSLSEMERNQMEMKLSSSLYDSYYNLRMDLYLFFQPFFRVEKDYPLIHQFLYRYQIRNLFEINVQLKEDFASFLSQSQYSDWCEEWKRWELEGMDSCVPLYFCLWESILEKRKELFPLLNQYMSDADCWDEDEGSYFHEPVYCFEDAIVIYDSILFYLRKQCDEAQNLEERRRGEWFSKYESLLVEKERFETMKDQGVWQAFHAMDGKGGHPSFSWAGQYLYDQLIFSIDWVLFQVDFFKWTDRAYQCLPADLLEGGVDEEEEKEVNVDPSLSDYRTDFCRLIALKIHGKRGLTPYLVRLKDFDTTLQEDVRMRKECEFFIPAIERGHYDQLNHFLQRFNERIGGCRTAVHMIPIDLYEIYHQYPDQMDNFEEAFFYIMMEKRIQVVKGIANQQGRYTHNLRQILNQLLTSSYSIRFHPSFLQNRSDILFNSQSVDLYLSLFHRNFSISHVFLEEILPLFWSLHKGVTTKGRQFHVLAQSLETPFLDVAEKDVFKGLYLFVDPLFLFRQMMSLGLIEQKDSSEMDLTSYEEKEHKVHIQLKNRDNSSRLSDVSPGQFLRYFKSLPDSDKIEEVKLLDMSWVCQKLCPLYDLEKELVVFQEILDLSVKYAPLQALQLFRESLMVYGEQSFFSFFSKNDMLDKMLVLFKKVLLFDQQDHIEKVLSLISNSYLAPYFFPVFVECFDGLPQKTVLFYQTHLKAVDKIFVLSFIPETMVYEIFCLLKIDSDGFLKLMMYIYLSHPQSFVSFYQSLFPLYFVSTRLEKKRDCVDHMIENFSSKKKDIMYFFVQHFSEEELKDWIVFKKDVLCLNKKYRRQFLLCLKNLGYYTQLYSLLLELGLTQDLHDLIFNLFICKQWDVLFHWSCEWVQNPSFYHVCLEDLFLCFELIHPRIFRSRFLDGFSDQKINPLHDLYSLYQKYRKNINFIELISESYSLELEEKQVSLEKENLLSESYFQDERSSFPDLPLEVSLASFRLRSA